MSIKILNNDLNQNIILNNETDFKTDLGWEESFQEFEQDTLKSIINPSVNFETVRYIHKSCVGPQNIDQSDIWFYFYFYNNETPPTHIGGLNYQYIGLTPEKNSKVLRQDNESFFRLEFYKVPEGQNPNSSNRKLAFTKHLPIALGEKVKYTITNEYIYVPVFMGSNFRNKENMYLFWFQDNTVLDGTLISGNTFYMTARFFNTIDGKIISFTNTDKGYTDAINEETDVYYKVIIDRSDYSYAIYSGDPESRIGCSTDPIRFYSTRSSASSIIPPTPSATLPVPSVTPSITPSPPAPSVTPSISVSSSVAPRLVIVTNYNGFYNIIGVSINSVDVTDILYPVSAGHQIVGTTLQIGSYTVVVTLSAVSNGEGIDVNGDCQVTTYEDYKTYAGVDTTSQVSITYSRHTNCMP